MTKADWDTDMLNGLAILIPKVKEAYKQGDPYVTIR